MSERARVDLQTRSVRAGGFIPAPLAQLAKIDDDFARLVVVEEGVQHFEGQLPRDNSEHTVVVAQVRGESYTVLAQRVRKARASLARAGKRIGPAIVVLSTRQDTCSFRSRLLLGKSLLERLPVEHESPAAELSWIATDCGYELRLELMSIVETLVAESGSGQPPMRLRFPKSATTAEPEPASGVFLRKSGEVAFR